MGLENKIKSPIDERFIEILSILIDQDKFRNFTNLGEIFQVVPHSFSEILAGIKNVSEDQINRVCTEFPDINKAYILTGVQPRFFF